MGGGGSQVRQEYQNGWRQRRRRKVGVGREKQRRKEERNKDSRPGNERGRMEVTTGERERKNKKYINKKLKTEHKDRECQAIPRLFCWQEGSGLLSKSKLH